MSLKDYQERIVREVHDYLRVLVEVRGEGMGRYAAMEAWRGCGIV